MPPRNVVLIGFMGSGKSSVAHALAERLGYEAVDTDVIVEAEAGRSVGEVFAAEGEAGFRARESAAVGAAAAGAKRVIACGGGAILAIRNLSLLQEAGPIVYLRATVETLIARLGDGAGRPLLGGDPATAVPELLAQRSQAYRAAADLVVDTDGRTADEVADQIVRALDGPA